MSNENKASWCIVRFYNTSPDRKKPTDLIVTKLYQWTAHSVRFQLAGKYEIVAEGIPTNEEACEWVRKYEKLLEQ